MNYMCKYIYIQYVYAYVKNMCMRIYIYIYIQYVFVSICMEERLEAPRNIEEPWVLRYKNTCLIF